jgi:ACS family glucarate transporter-like MFS transporter
MSSGWTLQGGRRIRWSIFACLLGFAFCAYVQRTSVAIAAERMMPELGLTQVEIGWLLTVFLVSYTVFQLPGGAIGQRWGARRTLVFVSALALVATLATAVLPSILTGATLFVSLLVARFTLGVAQSPIFPAASGVIENWFPSARWSFPQGLMNTGINLGAAVTPPLVAWLMQTVSWQFALVVTSIPLLGLTVYWSRRARDVPVDDLRVSAEELAELRFNPPPVTAAPTMQRMIGLLRDRDLFLLTLSYFFMNYAFYLLTFWCFLYFVQERHFTVLDSGWLTAAPFGAAAVGAAVGGQFNDVLCRRLGERWGFRGVPLIGLPIAAVALYLAVQAASPFWAVAALCIAFASIELTEGPYWAATMRVAGTDSMVATGLLNTGGNLGGIVGTPIVAALSAQHGWTAAFLTGSACSILSAALWLWIDPSRRRASSVATPLFGASSTSSREEAA